MRIIELLRELKKLDPTLPIYFGRAWGRGVHVTSPVDELAIQFDVEGKPKALVLVVEKEDVSGHTK